MSRLSIISVICMVALTSCSMTTAVHARFINGRLAILGIERRLGCIFDIEVREQASAKLVWELMSDFSGDRCSGDDPHFYGRSYEKLDVSVAPQKLKIGTIYEVSGTASGSNYFGGSFRIIRDGRHFRIEDMPRADLAENLLTNKNE